MANGSSMELLRSIGNGNFKILTKGEKMKKIILLTIIILTLSLTSCSGFGRTNFGVNEYEHADQTFSEIINAIKTEDASKLVDLFSTEVKRETDLLPNATKFINYIQGDIVSYSSASDHGANTSAHVTNGRKSVESNTSFSIETTEKTYYISMIECIRDDFDRSNKGIVSLTIIDADNWQKDYVYRAGGYRVPGIHIDDQTMS